MTKPREGFTDRPQAHKLATGRNPKYQSSNTYLPTHTLLANYEVVVSQSAAERNHSPLHPAQLAGRGRGQEIWPPTYQPIPQTVHGLTGRIRTLISEGMLVPNVQRLSRVESSRGVEMRLCCGNLALILDIHHLASTSFISR